MSTFSAKAQEIDRKWWIIDAADQIVGDVAVAAASLLRGKHKPLFTTHVDCGDFVVVINADKAKFSGNKETQKLYTSFSGYVGGHKAETPQKLRKRFPERIVEKAVTGMIPHTRLGRATVKKLKVYSGSEHPHEAQSPVAFKLGK
jgi:large subunit ribosomal protein L13